ncbi:MAG: guanylate kinase [Proteobacteria bacterium]|nr:guanylate kinase [Pseudomonadota bacterium]MDA0869406.1 guanylate kinase [Pseudomonadota bacterium]MDA1329030.1 guanylate kinase [Pseudomonadota bacterium]
MSAPHSPQQSIGNLYVVAAPSGAGKSSLVKALMELDARVTPSVSHTTRAPRGQEMDGREYFFVDDATFDTMTAREEFLEWAHVHGHRYGTSRLVINERIASGMDVVLEIDYQGALQIQHLFPDAVLVFILPPSWDELRARLLRRAEDDPSTIELRLQNAQDEAAHAHRFDFVIINEVFDRALFDLKAIVQAQRLRYEAQKRLRHATFAALGLN